MSIVQTPSRVSLFGGGTDFISFFREEVGCVLSSAIDKYIFVAIKERFDTKLRIGYTETEMVDEIRQIHHELIREALRLTGIERGVELRQWGISLLYVPYECQTSIRAAFNSPQELPFRLEADGTKVIFNYLRS